MKTTIGADAAKLAGLQIDFFAKLKAGEITLDHFFWFLNLRKSERDRLLLGKENILSDWMKQIVCYYKDVFGLKITLTEDMFPENCPAYMAFDPRTGNEDQVMDAIQTYFNKKNDTVNLYKYLKPVSEKIKKDEELKISPRPSGLYVAGHSGEDEPDTKHRNKSYNMAVAEKLIFATAWEYLILTGFHKYSKGYFMDRKGWTRTSSAWAGGDLVGGFWLDALSTLSLSGGGVGGRHPSDGPRQLFLV